MGAFLNKRGSVASMASVFERASLVQSQQPIAESSTRWSCAMTKLSNGSNSASRSSDHSKSPPISPGRDEESNAEEDDVFSCASPNQMCQRSSTLDSVMSATSNTSQLLISKEQKHVVLEDKSSADCMSESEHRFVEKPVGSATNNVATKSGPLWSAPRKKQARNMHSSSPNPTDQSSIKASTSIHSATKSRVSRRRQCLSYDADAANFDLASADCRSHGQGIQQTLKKSYTMEADLLSVKAPKVKVRISSTKVDHCQLDMLTRYKQTSPAIVHVTGDVDSD